MKKVILYFLIVIASFGCGTGYVRFMQNTGGQGDMLMGSVQLWRKADGTFYVNLVPLRKIDVPMTEEEFKAEILKQLQTK